MKRFLTIMLLLCCAMALQAQIVVKEFYMDELDITANTHGTIVEDQNGEKCALIKVETTVKDLTFDVGALGVTKTERHPGETWVYCPRGVKRISIFHDDLGVLRDYDLGMMLESARTYRDKRVLPVFKRILKVLRGLFREFTDLKYQHEKLKRDYSQELGAAERMRGRIQELDSENKHLRAVSRDFDRVCRFFGRDRVTNAVETVKRQEPTQAQQHQPRPIRRHQQSL